MPAPKKNPVTKYIAKKITKAVAKKTAKKPVVKIAPKPNLKAKPKSNVTKTSPKNGPLNYKETEAKRISDAKWRAMKNKSPRPSWD